MEAYTLYALNMNDTSAGTDDYLIDQIESFGLNPGAAAAIGRSDGNVDQTYAATMGVDTTYNLSTSKLATVLGKSSGAFMLAGQALANGAFNAEAFFQKLEEGGTRESGSVNKKLVITKGLVVPRTIRAQQEGHAVMDLDVIATQDGTTDPVVVSDDALTGTPSVSELFTLGPVNINGTALKGVQGVTVDPGIELYIQKSAGLPYPQGVAIMSRAPSVVVELTDMAVLTSISLDGVDLSSGADFYFRKLESGGVRVADATEEHIKISVAAGMGHLEPVNLNHNGHAVPGIRITPIKSGAIFTIDTTSAIT